MFFFDSFSEIDGEGIIIIIIIIIIFSIFVVVVVCMVEILLSLMTWLEKRFPFHLNVLFSTPSVKSMVKVLILLL